MKTTKNMKSAAAAAALAAMVLGFGNARADELVFAVDSCADMQCVSDTINDAILDEADASLYEQAQQMAAKVSQPVVASVDTKAQRPRGRDGFGISGPSLGISVN